MALVGGMVVGGGAVGCVVAGVGRHGVLVEAVDVRR